MASTITAACRPLQMPPPPKAVLMALADCASDEGICRPTVAQLSTYTCLAERTVQRALEYLEEQGHLKRTEQPGGRTYYCITPATPSPEKATTPDPETQRQARRRPASTAFPEGVNGEIVLGIPILGGREWGVSKAFVAELERLFPGVDARQTLNEIRGWNLTNPTRRKTESGICRHIMSWFQKEQNR